MVTNPRKKRKRYGVTPREDRKITPVSELEPIVKKEGHYLYLVYNTAGEPMLRTPPQITRFAEHYEAMGYLTGRSKYPVSIDSNNVPRYANYLSPEPLPLSERNVMISRLGGKMKGMRAISTSPLLNRFCQKMAYKKCKLDKEGNVIEEDPERMPICRMCYSVNLLTPGDSGSSPHELGSRPGLARNTRLLSQNIIEKIPKINPTNINNWFRFSAEGELVNEVHLINLANIAIANPSVTFTLWTKRPDVVQEVFFGTPKQRAMMQKPRNLRLIRSSPVMNVQASLPTGFCKVFTVYSPEYLATHPEININCQKKCVGCGLCYTDNNITHINELLKPGSNLVGKIP